MVTMIFSQDPWSCEEKSSSSDTLNSVGSESNTDSDGPITVPAEITWYPLLGQSDDMAFFADAANEKELIDNSVANALIAGGFNLLNSPRDIYNGFERAGVQGRQLSLLPLPPSSTIPLLSGYPITAPLASPPVRSGAEFICYSSYLLLVFGEENALHAPRALRLLLLVQRVKILVQ